MVNVSIVGQDNRLRNNSSLQMFELSVEEINTDLSTENFTVVCLRLLPPKDFLDRFRQPSLDLLRYIGLTPNSKFYCNLCFAVTLGA